MSTFSPPPDEIEKLQMIANGQEPARFKFNARQLALHLADETPVARGGGQLFTYQDGHYRPGGIEQLRERITDKLGDEWKPGRADSTVTYLADSAPRLTDTPPVDRINVQNGILNLDTGKLDPHTPEFLTPIQLPVTYNPDATCPNIDKFLAQTLDPELAEVFYELAGYLTVPDNTLQTAVMMLGAGANGKSTALNVLTSLLGKENVSAVALHTLDDNRFAPVRLYGKLANVFADLDARALESSSVFKSITGGDLIEGERKHQDAFSFRPYARLLFSANEPPPTPDGSDAFFRRWLIVPFDRSFRGTKADPHLLNKLTTPDELSGLLNQGLARLYTLRKRGHFTTTEATTKAAERFQVDADSVAGFLADTTELDPDSRIPKPRLFPAYRNWCVENNRRPVSKQKFNRRVETLRPSLYETKVQGTICWSGIRLTEDAR